mmetsp:Transcript_53808/g.161030  ORF Transcript_53808/g.161030 Transcript_53808/m.161030 type:complete len:148 (-) Transcript_53808:839-1282(-)
MWEKNPDLIEGTPSLRLRRESNAFLMEDFLMAGYSGEELDDLNRCKIHLRIMTLADTVSGYERFFLPCVLNGQKTASTRPYYCPPQHNTGVRAWENWKSELWHTYNLQRTTVVLCAYQLEKWTSNQIKDGWAFSSSQDRLYHEKNGE